jgi:hypothetical protein
VYHHEEGEGVHVRTDADSLHQTETERRRGGSAEDDSDSSSDAELSEKNDEVTSAESEETKIEEIRGGIPDERDVEALPPQLEKKKSSRSIKDPNLVWKYAQLLLISGVLTTDRSHGMDRMIPKTPRIGQ